MNDLGDDVDVDLFELDAREERAKKRRAEARKGHRFPKLRIPGQVSALHPERPWWRLEGAHVEQLGLELGGRVWRRTDGQTWPRRPDEVLAGELALFDERIAMRPGAPDRWPPTSTPIPSYAWRRVARARAVEALEAVAKVARLERRLATWRRDARVRPSAVQAAAWTERQLEEQRRRVAALRVGVPWGGNVYGRGVAP